MKPIGFFSPNLNANRKCTSLRPKSNSNMGTPSGFLKQILSGVWRQEARTGWN
jgi:hypothetical protein